MYHPLFFMTFYGLGLDNKKRGWSRWRFFKVWFHDFFWESHCSDAVIYNQKI